MLGGAWPGAVGPGSLCALSCPARGGPRTPDPRCVPWACRPEKMGSSHALGNPASPAELRPPAVECCRLRRLLREQAHARLCCRALGDRDTLPLVLTPCSSTSPRASCCWAWPTPGTGRGRTAPPGLAWRGARPVWLVSTHQHGERPCSWGWLCRSAAAEPWHPCCCQPRDGSSSSPCRPLREGKGVFWTGPGRPAQRPPVGAILGPHPPAQPASLFLLELWPCWAGASPDLTTCWALHVPSDAATVEFPLRVPHFLPRKGEASTGHVGGEGEEVVVSCHRLSLACPLLALWAVP